MVIPEDYQLMPASLSELIANERITVWYSVPFALIQLLLHGALDKRDLRALRWVIYGGEPFPLKHLKALIEDCEARLQAGASAIDIVEFAVAEMEVCGLYVAGRGSAPNSAGYVELDASIMDGATRRAGAALGAACPGSRRTSGSRRRPRRRRRRTGSP